MRPSSYLRNSGVSLVEYVLGLAILAIVLVGVGLFFLSQPRQLDPVFQFRAVSLAEALSEQVLAVKYDANNNPVAQERCGINGVTACAVSACSTPSVPIKELRAFEYLDDFNEWCVSAINGKDLAGQLGLDRTEFYLRYDIQARVNAETDDDGTGYKKVIIDIGDQNGDTLSFTLHRYNIR